ncbi:MAG: efflux transporter outer membrane subunit [Pseudomonadales bacterium]
MAKTLKESAMLVRRTHAATVDLSAQAYHIALIVVLVLVGLCGCSAMETPEFERPQLPQKSNWSAELAGEQRIDLKWWHGFDEPMLDALMEQAIGANLDLALLAARTEVAGSQISQARARLLPILNFGSRTDTSNISGSTNLPTTNKIGVGGDMLWEIDVWGKARKGVAAQKAAYAASEADWRAGYLVMASNVSSAYFQVRQSDQQLNEQQAAIDRAEEILSMQQQMHSRGLVAETIVLQQQAELHRLHNQKLELERVRGLTVNALATLVGEVAGEFSVPHTAPWGNVEPIAVPIGLPSQMLSRRPDLVAAEYRLLQAVQLEGQSRLAQMPTIGLTGLGGSASFGLSDLLKTWTAGLSSVVQFPVFNPNVRAQIKVSEAQVQVAEAQYRRAVFAAFEEVENVLVNLNSRRQQRSELTSRRNRLQTVQERTLVQLELGLISRLEVLERERSLLDAEQALLANRWQLVDDTVALFKAVGGGWDPDIVAQR